MNRQPESSISVAVVGLEDSQRQIPEQHTKTRKSRNTKKMKIINIERIVADGTATVGTGGGGSIGSAGSANLANVIRGLAKFDVRKPQDFSDLMKKVMCGHRSYSQGPYQCSRGGGSPIRRTPSSSPHTREQTKISTPSSPASSNCRLHLPYSQNEDGDATVKGPRTTTRVQIPLGAILTPFCRKIKNVWASNLKA